MPIGIGLSIVTPDRQQGLLQKLNEVSHIEGDVAECGVYNGGTALQLARALVGGKKKLLLFDSFIGLPNEIEPIDYHKPGEFTCESKEKVIDLFKSFNFVEIFVGFFKDTFGTVPERKYSLVHVDADLYHSVKQCCEFFYPLMSKGGILVFDDYTAGTCLGAKKAVDEFLSDKLEKLEITEADAAFFRKI